ncbi:MAG: aminotransferase class V-fold PLP-dependent enzyme [Ruminococcaceae bacterium]|nr:aminotransferase class V-fold PLP-dependent enzyme [Oscillospiraceae bacterium]
MNSKTPICDFVKEYIDSETVRLHMPGHKGVSFVGPESFDITEIDGADVLYDTTAVPGCDVSNGIIRRSEKITSDLFGSGATLFSTEGSSLCIRAMLFMTSQYAALHGKNNCIVAPRNSHKTFVTAAALLDIDVKWIFSTGGNILSYDFDLNELDRVLAEVKPVALYITSPDYLGNVADIEEISRVCKSRGVLLLVDNAHGAYLKFLPKSLHPIDLGADLCCDSAHKTLPALTGAAYLHISKNADEFFVKNASFAMSMFASTSPSYLILQSLDLMNEYLSDKFSSALSETIERVKILKEFLDSKGYETVGCEPLKLTLKTKPYGYRGNDFADILKSKNIVCEFSDPDFVVMMFTPQISVESIDYLTNVFAEINKKPGICDQIPRLCVPKVCMSLKQAVMAPFEIVSVKESVGRISAAPSVNCPPAVPVVVCGEVIDESAVKCFEYYGIETVAVVK